MKLMTDFTANIAVESKYAPPLSPFQGWKAEYEWFLCLIIDNMIK